VSLSLQIEFRGRFRLPLQDWDIVEVWDMRCHTLYFTISGELLKTLLRHHLDGLAMQALMQQQMDKAFQPKIGQEPMPEQNPVDQPRRERFRAARLARDRRRKPPAKMLISLALAATALMNASGNAVHDVNDLLHHRTLVLEAPL
jgi:hypothetical protein